jgi:hypothetical protein
LLLFKHPGRRLIAGLNVHCHSVGYIDQLGLKLSTPVRTSAGVPGSASSSIEAIQVKLIGTVHEITAVYCWPASPAKAQYEATPMLRGKPHPFVLATMGAVCVVFVRKHRHGNILEKLSAQFVALLVKS